LEKGQKQLDRIQHKEIPNIAAALSSFSGVWQDIAAQCNLVVSYIKAGMPDEVSTQFRWCLEVNGQLI
jgi:hypothetical protein